MFGSFPSCQVLRVSCPSHAVESDFKPESARNNYRNSIVEQPGNSSSKAGGGSSISEPIDRFSAASLGNARAPPAESMRINIHSAKPINLKMLKTLPTDGVVVHGL